MIKAQFLKHWRTLLNPRPLKPATVPYKHRGSTFQEDGIRITGSLEWIDAVLSRLTDLLACENGRTRLQVSYRQANDKEGKPLASWTCYIQVHERGREAQIMHCVYGTPV